MSSDLDVYWHELVTGALLGTDRREPPRPPAGAVADLVDDAVRPDGASRMLAAVGAVAVARRAAFVAGPPAGRLQPPQPDDRPCCSSAAVSTWRTVVAEWPVLEDEWVLAVIQRGLRVPPDALVELLQRHRGDGVRRARVEIAGGPLAAWLVDHVPSLAAGAGKPPTAEAVATLPELPVPPELAHLLGADAHTFVRRIAQGFDAGEFQRPAPGGVGEPVRPLSSRGVGKLGGHVQPGPYRTGVGARRPRRPPTPNADRTRPHRLNTERNARRGRLSWAQVGWARGAAVVGECWWGLLGEAISTRAVVIAAAVGGCWAGCVWRGDIDASCRYRCSCQSAGRLDMRHHDRVEIIGSALADHRLSRRRDLHQRIGLV